MKFPTLVFLALFVIRTPAEAGSPAVAAPKKASYPGTILLQVDATDLERGVFRVRQTMPVKAGPLTLLYPEWVPGAHAPRGPIDALAGLTLVANGQTLPWSRDPLDVYAFHVRVPAGAAELRIELQYASPRNKDQGRITMTPQILGVQWEKMLVYPAGYQASGIAMAASVTLPAGWGYGTALRVEKAGVGTDNTVRFQMTSLETLIDSPLFAGKYFKRETLEDAAAVTLNVFADMPEELAIQPEQLAVHRKLVKEATTLFGSRHYDRYDFLLSISEHFGGIGLEHHRSSENGVRGGYFKEWDKSAPRRDLLAHEFVHSWNGKFRRPADLWTANYNVPMQDSLLWVYEGQTQYWGYVLAARSGLWDAQTARDAFAMTAAMLREKRAGRAWRNLQDTTYQPIVAARRPLSYVSWQRTEDYYTEGQFVWLDVDTLIREKTGGAKSLDDFARAFFGIDDGSYAPRTYAFQDVVRTLQAVTPHEWAGFLRERLDRKAGVDDGKDNGAPLDGLARAGWKLVFEPEPSEYLKKLDTINDRKDFSYSIGIVLDKDAKLTEVVWGSPAFKAGLSTAATLIAVNGVAYKAEVLEQAIRDTQDAKQPVELLVKALDRYRTVKLDYAGGARYPHLERIEGTPDRLSDILKPRT